MTRTIRLLECGCCGQYHPAGPLLPGGSANDCRNDANRFQGEEDFTRKTGLPCVEVWLEEQEEDAYWWTADLVPLPPLTLVEWVCGIVDRHLGAESDMERDRR